MKKMYMKFSRYEITPKGNEVFLGSYTQPIEEISTALESEFYDSEEFEKKFYIIVEPVFLTKEEYESLPEFIGY